MSSTVAPIAWKEKNTDSDDAPAETRHGTRTASGARSSVLAVVFFGCLLSVGAYLVADQRIGNDERESFRAEALQRIAEVRTRVDISIKALHAVRGLFAASIDIDRHAFSQFVNALELPPGVQGLEWVPKVTASQRLAYKRRARRDGIPNFEITERDETGRMRPAGGRDWYFPVYFSEPVKGNQTAIGFDLASNPSQLRVLQLARDTGKAVATMRLAFAREAGDQTGIFVFLPVYRNGIITETLQDRRQNLTGFALGVVRVGDLVEGIFNTAGTDNALFNAQILDRSASDENQLLYPNASSAPDATKAARATASDRFVVTENLTVGGRAWQILLSPSRAGDDLLRAWQPWTVLVAGIFFTAMVALYVRQFLSHSLAVEMLAAERKIELDAATADLQRSNRDVDHFAYIASHDLKAPLRNIDNLAEWIEDDLGDALNGDTRESMTLLRGRVARLGQLLDDLLEYSRVGREECQVTRVDTNSLIEEISDLLRPPTGIEVKTVGELPRFDTVREPLDQIFRHLIDNAIKHHDRQTGYIEVSAVERGDFFTFSVADDGPGIDPKFHEAVFQVFKTLKPRDMVEGSGMGLAIVKKQVERRRGHIRIVSSAEERGAIFEFDWPKLTAEK